MIKKAPLRRSVWILSFLATFLSSYAQSDDDLSSEEIAARDRDAKIVRDRPARLLEQSTWNELFLLKDYLSIRMATKDLLANAKLAKHPKLWYSLREKFLADPLVGQDLRSLWDKLGPRNTEIQRTLEKRMRNTDEMLRNLDFRRAVVALGQMLKSLVAAKETSKLRYRDFKEYQGYLLVSLARALYGAGEFKKAAITYEAIKPGYYDFSQILVERIWANYRAGRNDWVLGDLASLMSGYFGKVSSPDVLIVGIYAAYEYCQNDLANFLRETYLKNLKLLRSRSQFFDVHGGDPVLLTLRLTLDSSEFTEKFTDLYTKAEREAEKKVIAGFLIAETERRREGLRTRYETYLPYLASAPKIEKYLHKKKLASRSEIFQGPFNVTRLVKAEIWSDEIGFLLFRPRNETTCKSGVQGFEIQDNAKLTNVRVQKDLLLRNNFKDYQDQEKLKRMFFFPLY